MTDETPPRRGLLGALHRYRRVLGVRAAGFGLLMAGIFLSQLDGLARGSTCSGREPGWR
ncbi:MAG: hypothetical protein R3F43_01120 [bacterium]